MSERAPFEVATIGDDRCDFLGAADHGNGLGIIDHWLEMRSGCPWVDHHIACQGAWRNSTLLVAITYPPGDFWNMGGNEAPESEP